MLIRFLSRGFLDDDGGADGGERDDGASKVRASELRAQLGSTVDEQALTRILEKQAEVLNDNYRLRKKRDILQDEIKTLRAAQPADGGRVLTKDEAAAYDAYVALGEPKALKTTLESASTATERLATLERTELIRAAAEAHGYRADALGRLPSLTGKDITLRDVQEDGKTVKRAFVGDDPLPAYIEANDAVLMPALVTEQHGGTQFIPQGGTGGKPSGDMAARFIEQQDAKRKAQSNPLMKQGA